MNMLRGYNEYRGHTKLYVEIDESVTGHTNLKGKLDESVTWMSRI
jgi:hypothetical protein